MNADELGAQEPFLSRDDFIGLDDRQKWHLVSSERQARLNQRAIIERLREQQGYFSQMPVWFRLAIVNFPVFTAIYFMAQSTGILPNQAAKESQENGILIRRLDEAIARHSQESAILVARLSTALRIMCENASKDEATRNNCKNIPG